MIMFSLFSSWFDLSISCATSYEVGLRDFYCLDCLPAGQIRIIPFGAATYFSVQKPFGSSMIGHQSERFCVFLPIFDGRDGAGNEQKLGEEWGQAKQWSQYFEKKTFALLTPA